MPMLWVDTKPNFTISNNSSQLEDLLVNLAERSRAERMTLTRTIIGLDIAYLTHDAGEGSQQVFIGIGTVGADAYAIGSSATPDPSNMADYPSRGWVWRAAYRVYGFAADQPAVFNQRIDMDIRSQRKLENGVMMIRAGNTPFEGVTSVITVSGIVRQLWRV